MSIQVGIGFSQESSPITAARQASEQALIHLNRERIDIALIFNTEHYNPYEFLSIAFKTLKSTQLVGCTTAGIILSEKVHTRGIGVVAISSDDIKFEANHVNHLNLQSVEQIGPGLVKTSASAFGKHDQKVMLLFINSQYPHFADLWPSIRGVISNPLMITGAGSCDYFHQQIHYQYYRDTVMTNGATSVLLGGNIHFGISSRHGFKPLGKPRVADEVEGRLIRKINGEQAFQFYEEYFEKDALGLRQDLFNQIHVRYPLGITTSQGDHYLLRHIMEVKENGSLLCQDTVKNKSNIHIMIGSKYSCLLSAYEAAEELKNTLGDAVPKLILIIESLFRYKILGKDMHQEIKSINSVFGNKPQVIGMYAQGEITSFHNKDKVDTQLNNGSITLLAIC